MKQDKLYKNSIYVREKEKNNTWIKKIHIVNIYQNQIFYKTKRSTNKSSLHPSYTLSLKQLAFNYFIATPHFCHDGQKWITMK